MTNKIRQLKKSTSPIEFDSIIPRFSAVDFEWIDPHEIRDLKNFGREDAFILPVSKVLTRELSFAVDFSISELANFVIRMATNDQSLQITTTNAG
jgi:hypothetical protein